MNQLWNQIAGQAGIELTEQQLGAFSRYLDLLQAANERMNLTRISDRAMAEIQHVADALTLLPYLPKGSIAIADVGSGGGVPGIPLAIARPDARITLIEATKKKAAFLKEAIAALELTNVQVLDQRGEDVGNGPCRETFHVATTRAVGEMGWLSEWCLPLLRMGGIMLAMKGPKWVQEMPIARPIIHRLGGNPEQVHEVQWPELAGHVIVQVKKNRPTPMRFPRAATEAKGKMMS